MSPSQSGFGNLFFRISSTSVLFSTFLPKGSEPSPLGLAGFFLQGTDGTLAQAEGDADFPWTCKGALLSLPQEDQGYLVSWYGCCSLQAFVFRGRWGGKPGVFGITWTHGHLGKWLMP